MIKKHIRKPITLALLACTLLSFTLNTTAQEPPAKSDSTADPMLPSMHYEAWLKSRNLGVPTISGGAWIYHAEKDKDRRLLLVPLKLHPVSQQTVIEPGYVRLTGGRFVGYVLDFDTPDKIARAHGITDTTIKLPRFVSRFTLLPESRISWQFPRQIYGGILVTPQQGYGLVVKPTNLKRPLPPQLEKPKRGMSLQELKAIHEQQKAEFKKRLDKYEAEMEMVKALPLKFQADYPSKVWAVFEISDKLTRTKLTINDVDIFQGTVEHYDLLRRYATQFVRDDEALVKEIKQSLESSLQYKYALGSVVASYVSHIRGAEPGSDLAKIIHEIQNKGDRNSRLRIVTSLIRIKGRSPIASSIFENAINDKDPLIHLAGMQGKLAFDSKDEKVTLDQIKQFVDAINKMLADESVSPLDMIEVALEVAKTNPHTVDYIAENIQLDKLNRTYRREALLFILEQADRNSTLANRWIGLQLLSDKNESLQELTLNEIANQIRESLKRSNKQVITRTIYTLDTPNHGLLKLLHHADPAIRMEAWLILPAFKIDLDMGKERDQVIDRTIMPLAIAKAAAQSTPTPAAVVEYLSNIRRSDVTPAYYYLLKHATGPGQAAAAKILSKTSTTRVAEALVSLSPQERATLVQSWYQTSRTNRQAEMVTPATVGEFDPDLIPWAPVFYEPNNTSSKPTQLMTWFAKAITADEKPGPVEVAGAAGGFSTLMPAIRHQNETYAKAAAALVVATMWEDPASTEELYKQVRNLPDYGNDRGALFRDANNKWLKIKQNMLTERTKELAGDYVLKFSMNVKPEKDDPDYDPENPYQKVKRTYNIFNLTLVNDNGQFFPKDPPIKMGIAHAPFGLSIERPRDVLTPLKVRDDIPSISWPTKALILVPQNDKWVATFEFRNEEIKLFLERSTQQ